MAKKKAWRVLEEFDGKVTIENEKKQVVLSNSLPADVLEALAKDALVVGFLEQATITETENGG